VASHYTPFQEASITMSSGTQQMVSQKLKAAVYTAFKQF